MQPFDQADESRANSVTGVQVIDVPVEVSLDPVTAALQSDITVTVSIVGGTAQGTYRSVVNYSCSIALKLLN